MSEPWNYGGKYYRVRVPLHMAKGQQIYLNADRIEITPSGVLAFYGKYRDADPVTGKHKIREGAMEELLLALAPDEWLGVYAASCLDGRPVAVDHWEEDGVFRITPRK